MNNRHKPVLICGPTASGKSALALALAQRSDGIVVNADSLQVYDCWRILSARPSVADEALAEHRLYGHMPYDAQYSVGAWLREVARLMRDHVERQIIIVGGTGLYFTALTRGLTDIPATPDAVRAEGNAMRARGNVTEFIDYLDRFDRETLVKTDRNNAMRLQRAWEVHRTTGRGLASWQRDTPAPLVPLHRATAISMVPDVAWLNTRIERRFEKMVSDGALDECRAILENGWNPALPASRALGAAELSGYLRGETSLQDAQVAATIATRQFAKRQRTWFRNKMADWQRVTVDSSTNITDVVAGIPR